MHAITESATCQEPAGRRSPLIGCLSSWRAAAVKANALCVGPRLTRVNWKENPDWLSWDSIHPDGTNTQNDRLRGPASAKKHQRSVWGSLNFIPGTPPPASDDPLQQCPLKWAAKWNGASLVTAGEENSWIRATARLSLHLHLFFPTTGITMVGCSVLPVTGALWVQRASSPVWCKYQTRRIMTFFLTLAAWIMF